MNNLFLNLYVKFQILIDREDGQDMIEYVLAAALISLGGVAGIGHLAAGINTVYTSLYTKFIALVS